MQNRPVSYSRMEVRYRSTPADANNAGVMHGGKILYQLDVAAGMTASRHAGGHVTTASIERMDFLEPVIPGEILIIKTSVNMVGRSSMEVGARLEAEDPFSGTCRRVGRAYLIFVGMGEDGKPRPLPGLDAETDEDRRRLQNALQRKALRAR